MRCPAKASSESGVASRPRCRLSQLAARGQQGANTHVDTGDFVDHVGHTLHDYRLSAQLREALEVDGDFQSSLTG